jgi:hypothetical protein
MGSKSDKGQLSETPQEKALADIGLAEFQNYTQKWLPLQKRSISMLEGMKESDSFERERARGRAATGVGGQVDEAAEQIESVDRGRGVDAGSSNFVMRQGKVGMERAKAVGLNMASTEDMMDDAYVQGLAGLVQAGRQQGNIALEGMGRSARIASANEQAGAMEGAARRAGNAELAGTLISSGVQAGRGIKWGQGGSNFAPGENPTPFSGRF